MRNLVALVWLGLLVVVPSEVVGKTKPKDWYADIHVWVGKAHNRLTVGQTKETAEGHDYQETPIPRMFLVGRVCSYFYHPEWKQTSPFFWRDIRPIGGLPRLWEFVVKTKQPNVKVQLNWHLSRVKQDIQLYLKRKEDKEYINLHSERSYTYKSAKKENVFLLKAVEITPP